MVKYGRCVLWAVAACCVCIAASVVVTGADVPVGCPVVSCRACACEQLAAMLISWLLWPSRHGLHLVVCVCVGGGQHVAPMKAQVDQCIGYTVDIFSVFLVGGCTV